MATCIVLIPEKEKNCQLHLLFTRGCGYINCQMKGNINVHKIFQRYDLIFDQNVLI